MSSLPEGLATRAPGRGSTMKNALFGTARKRQWARHHGHVVIYKNTGAPLTEKQFENYKATHRNTTRRNNSQRARSPPKAPSPQRARSPPKAPSPQRARSPPKAPSPPRARSPQRTHSSQSTHGLSVENRRERLRLQDKINENTSLETYEYKEAIRLELINQSQWEQFEVYEGSGGMGSYVKKYRKRNPNKNAQKANKESIEGKVAAAKLGQHQLTETEFQKASDKGLIPDGELRHWKRVGGDDPFGKSTPTYVWTH